MFMLPIEAGFFRFTIVKDMKHVYPNGSNYPVNVTRFIGNFSRTTKNI